MSFSDEALSLALSGQPRGVHGGAARAVEPRGLVRALAGDARGGISPSASGTALRRAGRSAVATTGNLGKRVGTSIKAELDTDKDGEVSVEDLESTLRRWRHRWWKQT